MTAPRKPVAWAIGNPDGTLNRLGAIYHSERIAQDHINSYKPDYVLTAIPLYTETNLQPLWALVEKFEREAESEARRANKQTVGRDRHIYSAMQRARAEALADAARELRANLEAMNGR